MSHERIKPLLYAGIAGLLSAVIVQSGAQAQEAPKQEQSNPVEETAPFEQAQDAADGITVPDYRDDRSTPQALIESYYNAINRKEYGRAYSYYQEDAREPDFNNFVEGYKGTKSVKVAVRKTEPDPGAGQIYWSVPVAIESENDDGKKEVYSGCYTIHLSNPGFQDEPPYKPMQIMTGSLTKSPLAIEKSVPEICEAP
ncbi:hypothetical protein KUG47_05410 [Falsochrobactrum sp. TDYN1]|uniref:Uncharacterized protein n=1 Tax=Falsochrobactrum tianjinense TaxID=2706015 RepID=A0A949UUC0_9HYPH|nr:hypothetical protein [Falsochrobactrum sp. TDYN1]MBV2142933.1 hypothetical protein [Falsochrobactrum sp. TDYN1]